MEIAMLVGNEPKILHVLRLVNIKKKLQQFIYEYILQRWS